MIEAIVFVSVSASLSLPAIKSASLILFRSSIALGVMLVKSGILNSRLETCADLKLSKFRSLSSLKLTPDVSPVALKFANAYLAISLASWS